MDGQEEVLEVYGLDAVGYRRVMAFGQWRVAVLAHADMFAEEKCVKQERHLETDEAFVLLDGSAALVVGEKGDMVYIASEECAIRAVEPELDTLWSPGGGQPVIVTLNKKGGQA